MTEKPTLGLRRLLVIAGLNVALGSYSVAVADFVRNSSSSVVTDMFLILGWVALVGLVAYLEAATIRQLVVRGGWRGELEIGDSRSNQPRPWRDLHFPLTIAIATLFGINMFLFDQLSGGFFIEGQETSYTITRLRSSDSSLRREGILTAAKLSDPRARRALVELLSRPFDQRPLALWALGKIGSPAEAEPLLALLRSGTAEERAAAAVALARLRDERLPAELSQRLRTSEEPLESYLFALGLLGDRHATWPIVEVLLDDRTAPDHLALAAWALGELSDPRACPVLAAQVGPSANPLTCAALSGFATLRCAGSSQPLIEAFEASRPEARCDPRSFVDLDGLPSLLWSTGLYRVKVLRALFWSRDPSVPPWLRAVSLDGRQVPQIRHLARQGLTRQPPRASRAGSRPGLATAPRPTP